MYDCPSFPGVFESTAAVAGASIKGAELLNSNEFDVVVNWFGGWHHAQR